MHRFRYRWMIIILLLPLLLVSYTNCSQQKNNESTSLGSSDPCGQNLPASLRNPQTIDQMNQLIAALPKPLQIDCFILALKRPLQIYAVDSTASVQPSAGPASPRIFIINGKLVMGVVPKGPALRLLEVSEKVSGTSSVKGELRFPVDGTFTLDAPYSHILQAGGGTSCRSCHFSEARHLNITTGEAYASNIVFPDSSKRISSSALRVQSYLCDDTVDAYRCRMLRALMIDGQAQDGSFP